MADEITLLGIAGSLRSGSYNRAALRAAQHLLPPGVSLGTYDIGRLPLFNQDREREPNQAVQELKAAIRAADGILFVTPEYNYSVPGVLKNAIDCASRPYDDNAWEGKPAGIMGASVGMIGTARAQYHLRQSMVFLNMLPLNQPEVMIPFAADKFDGQGELTDEKTKDKIKQLIEALVQWVRVLQKGRG